MASRLWHHSYPKVVTVQHRSSPLPTSTYRLQFNSAFTFDDAVEQVGYLADLGVSHIFCSPILQAAPGSMHGYDVVDHSRISEECGGIDGFRRLVEAAHRHELGIVVDVVPNHMAVPTPLWRNSALWDVLRNGNQSAYASWFDIDVSSSRAVLMPVLGRRIGEELADGTIRVEPRDIHGSRERVVTYFDHVFPIRPGTEELPIEELLERQWYRLAYWKVANEELNYRRFFDVDTLAALRVEDDDVFDQTHRLLLDLYGEGLIDGFRIDHPDGLANPRGYLQRLDRATDGAWVVVEKILEPHERLPENFRCAGTTGYDSLLRVEGLFHDPNQLPRLDEIWARQGGAEEGGFSQVLLAAKHDVVHAMLFTEVNRLTSIAVTICESDLSLFDHTRREIGRAISALLIQMDRYRAYVEPGLPAGGSERRVIDDAAARVRPELDDDERSTLDLIVRLVLGDSPTGDEGHDAQSLPNLSRRPTPEEAVDPIDMLRAEFMIRFAQTCGPVMAKSKEDTAFYRWNRFVAVNEVGSEPTIVGVSTDAFHDFCTELCTSWPSTMTTLSTHDTKRSEDVRARLTAMLEHAKAWESCVAELRAATEAVRSPLVDGPTELLLWQTLVSTWRLPGSAAGTHPISQVRLTGYLTKAMREAKAHTTWTAPDAAYEESVLALAVAALTDERCAAALDSFVDASYESARGAILGSKLIALTMPGIPDIYQGNELVDLSLVDPDNRRPVDYRLRRSLLTSDAHDLDAEKQLVVRRALDVRRRHADAFRGPDATYVPVATTSGQALAFARGTTGSASPVAVTVAARFFTQVAERGGWAEHQIILPEGRWEDALSGRVFEGGAVGLAEIFTELPVALLTAVGR